MKKIKKFLNFVYDTVLVIGIVVALFLFAILILFWWIGDSLFRVFFPKKWEENTKRREKEFDDWMYEKTKNQGWAWQKHC